jgi:hypothetical protein
MAHKIAILEDNKERQAAMRYWLADRFFMYEACIFADAKEMIQFLDRSLGETLVISLDHDLELTNGANGRCADPGTGRQVADFLATRKPVCSVIIHTTNSDAAIGMRTVLEEAGWRTRRVVPHDDLQWINTHWFPAVRRAIVGPVRRSAVSGNH